MGETISYSGGDIPYLDRAVEITPDTPLPDSEAIKEIKYLRAAHLERHREVERLYRRLEEISKIATEALDYDSHHHSDRDRLFKALWTIECGAEGVAASEAREPTQERR